MYTGRILKSWLHRQTPLGLAWTYANWIRRSLSESYEQPLMKAFVEQTYRSYPIEIYEPPPGLGSRLT